MKASIRENSGEDSPPVEEDKTTVFAVEHAQTPLVLGGSPSDTAETDEGGPNDPLTCLDEPPNSSHLRRHSDADSAERDKGLKRKLADRATSQGPQDSSQIPQVGADMEPLKRHRDDVDNDDNPREGKRPSPPPESGPEPKKTPASKLVRHLVIQLLIT